MPGFKGSLRPRPVLQFACNTRRLCETVCCNLISRNSFFGFALCKVLLHVITLERVSGKLWLKSLSCVIFWLERMPDDSGSFQGIMV